MDYSVIIPVFNAQNTIEETLESVFTQTLPAKCVYVIDDASTDNSKKIIERFPVILIQNSINLGSGVSRNRALEQISSGIVAIIDSDDIWDTDYASMMMLEWQQAAENTGAIGMLLKPFGKVSADGYERQNKTLARKGKRFVSKKELAFHNPFYASATSFQVPVLKELGGWSQHPHAFSEDYSLLARILVADYSVLLVPKCVGGYRLSEFQKSANINIQLEAEIKISNFILSKFSEESTYFNLIHLRVRNLILWCRSILRSSYYQDLNFPNINLVGDFFPIQILAKIFKFKFAQNILISLMRLFVHIKALSNFLR